MPWPLFTLGKDPVPIVQEAGWAPGQVWTGAENLACIEIQSPDHPARSQSLYRLHYPAYVIVAVLSHIVAFIPFIEARFVSETFLISMQRLSTLHSGWVNHVGIKKETENKFCCCN